MSLERKIINGKDYWVDTKTQTVFGDPQKDLAEKIAKEQAKAMEDVINRQNRNYEEELEEQKREIEELKRELNEQRNRYDYEEIEEFDHTKNHLTKKELDDIERRCDAIFDYYTEDYRAEWNPKDIEYHIVNDKYDYDKNGKYDPIPRAVGHEHADGTILDSMCTVDYKIKHPLFYNGVLIYSHNDVRKFTKEYDKLHERVWTTFLEDSNEYYEKEIKKDRRELISTIIIGIICVIIIIIFHDEILNYLKG